MPTEREPYEPQEFNPKNLAKNKSHLSRRQQFILGTAGAAVGSTIIAGLAQACESDNPDTYPTTSPEATLTIETPPKPVFTTTTPDGSTVTIEIPTQTPTPEISPTQTPEVTPTPEQGTYENLIKQISSSSLTEREKAEYINQVENLKKIESIQAKLLAAYSSNLSSDNKTPELLHLTKLKYPSLPNFDAESQIFILQNQEILDTIVKPQLNTLSTNFNVVELKNTLEQIQFNTNHVFNPDGPYFGLNISLSDYLRLNSAENNKVTEITYENLSEAEINSLQTLVAELAPLSGKFTIRKANNFEPNYFQDLGNNYLLVVNPNNPQSLRHEWAHATNIEQNKSIAGSLTPEELVNLATLQEKALTDPDFGSQYRTLDQLFKKYSELNPYVAGSSNYPFETFITNTEANSQEKLYKIEPHTFATNSQTKEKFTLEQVAQILELKPNQYKSSKEFVGAKLPQLQKLAESSDFYAIFVKMLIDNPETMDNLASKISKNSIANHNYQSESNYVRFFVEYYCDSAFIVGLISGHTEIKGLYLSLSEQDQTLLTTNILALLQHADFETWAEGSRFSIQSPTPAPQENNPYTNYYDTLRNYLTN